MKLVKDHSGQYDAFFEAWCFWIFAIGKRQWGVQLKYGTPKWMRVRLKLFRRNMCGVVEYLRFEIG